MTVESSQMKVKGTLLRGIFRDIKETFPGGIPEFLNQLTEEEREPLKKQFLHNLWYPYETYIHLIAMALKIIGKGDIHYVDELAFRSAKRDLGTLFKLITLLTDPHIVAKRASIIWKQKFSRGNLVQADKTERGFVLEVVDFPEIHPLHCRIIKGYIEGVGNNWFKSFQAEKIGCVHQGHATCRYRCTW